MFDFVPFTRPRWEMADGDVKPDRIRQPLEFTFPEPHPIAITAATIGADQERTDAGVQRLAYMDPPAPNAFDRKTGGVMITAHIDPADVVANVIDPIGHGFAQLFIRKVMHIHGLWGTFWAPPLPRIFIGTHQFLLFRIHGDHGALAVEIPLH